MREYFEKLHVFLPRGLVSKSKVAGLYKKSKGAKINVWSPFGLRKNKTEYKICELEVVVHIKDNEIRIRGLGHPELIIKM